MSMIQGDLSMISISSIVMNSKTFDMYIMVIMLLILVIVGDDVAEMHPQRGQLVTKMVRPMTGKRIENANHFSSCKNSSPLFLVQNLITIQLEIMVTTQSNCSCGGKGGTQGVNWEAPEMGCTLWVRATLCGARTRQDNDSIMRRPTGYLHPNWTS